MKIGIMKRFVLAYRFWQALGEKKHNCVMSLIHENGFSSMVSANMSTDELEALEDFTRVWG